MNKIGNCGFKREVREADNRDDLDNDQCRN